MENKMKVIEIVQECSKCNGTGIYIGCAERDGFGVVCSRCDGTGRMVFRHSYYPFTNRKFNSAVKYVVGSNPGIALSLNGGDEKLTPEDFNAISYEDWLKGTPANKEIRKFTCPRWHKQYNNDWSLFNWSLFNCISIGSFSSCKNFKWKNTCWDLWDQETNKD